MRHREWGLPRLTSNGSISQRKSPKQQYQFSPHRPYRASLHISSFQQVKRRISCTSRPRAPTAQLPRPERVVFVVKDGSKVQETLPFFRYVVWGGGSVVGVLRASEEKLSPGRPFTHVYTYEGARVTSIGEITPAMRVILVSNSAQFEGLDWQFAPKSPEMALFKQLSARSDFRIHPLPGLTSPPRFPRVPSTQLPTSSSPKRAEAASPRLKPPIAQVDEVLRPLQNEQIAVLCDLYGLSIGKVHELYARYKTLLALNVYDKPACELVQGIDKSTFVHYLRGALIYGQDLLGRLFDTVSASSYMTWPQFAKAMAYLSVGSRKDKISLIFKLSAGSSSLLSYAKVRELCLMALGHAKRDAVVEEIADYFAQAVFAKAGIGRNEVVTAEKLEEVLEKDPDDEFLQLFCFNDLD